MSQNDESFKPQNTTEAKNESRVVRNIPIFLEGRNETIMNLDKTDASTNTTSSSTGHSQGHFPPSKYINSDSPKSFITRVKDIPMRNYIPSFDQTRRSASPGKRTPQHSIPLTKTYQQTSSSSSSTASSGISKDQQHEKFQEFHKTQQNSNNHKTNQTYDRKQEDQYKEQLREYQQERQQQYQKHQINRDDPRYDQTFTKQDSEPKPVSQSGINNPIAKINAILNEVEMLSEKVQKFPYGFNRKSKEYLYLDEMLTQNLLKLDTIDTEGKDEIKAYRKEVIQCINKSISNLESKVSSLSSLESKSTVSTVPKATAAISKEI